MYIQRTVVSLPYLLEFSSSLQIGHKVPENPIMYGDTLSTNIKQCTTEHMHALCVVEGAIHHSPKINLLREVLVSHMVLAGCCQGIYLLFAAAAITLQVIITCIAAPRISLSMVQLYVWLQAIASIHK
jgi:hypothetical protein